MVIRDFEEGFRTRLRAGVRCVILTGLRALARLRQFRHWSGLQLSGPALALLLLPLPPPLLTPIPPHQTPNSVGALLPHSHWKLEAGRPLHFAQQIASRFPHSP